MVRRLGRWPPTSSPRGLEGVLRADYISNQKNGGGLLDYTCADAGNGIGPDQNGGDPEKGADRYAVTAGLNYAFNTNVTFKVEYRYDGATQNVFGNKDVLSGAGTDPKYRKSNSLLATARGRLLLDRAGGSAREPAPHGAGSFRLWLRPPPRSPLLGRRARGPLFGRVPGPRRIASSGLCRCASTAAGASHAAKSGSPRTDFDWYYQSVAEADPVRQPIRVMA